MLLTGQGKFRRSLLDVSLLEYALNKIDFLREIKNKALVVTCLDHIVNEYRFTYEEELLYCDDESHFLDELSDILGFNEVYISKFNESKYIQRYV
jgi:hypothetical protein